MALDLAGAHAGHPGPADGPSAATSRHDGSVPVAPSREDPVVAGASEIVGGPLGRHVVVGASGIAGALAAIMAMVLGLVGLGVVEKTHCIAEGWTSPDHFWHACYSDIPVVYGASALSTGGSPFGLAAHVDQTAPTSLLAWGLATLVPSGGFGGAHARWYFALWAMAIAAMLVGLAGALVRAQPRHPWRVAHLASPVLPFLALTSFEVVPVALAGFGVVAWARRRPALAGVLLGLAAIARPWAVFVLLAIVLLAVRTGRIRDVVETVALAACAAVTGLVTVRLLGGDAFGVYRGWWGATASYGSPWYLPTIVGHPWPSGVLTAVACAGWLLAAIAGAVLALSTRRRPLLGEIALVMLVVAALTGKSLPVQEGLWMVLLMALCGLRWRTHLVWAGIEVAYFVAVWLHIGATSDPNRGLPGGWYAVFVVARVAAWAWVAIEVWRRAAARPAASAVAPESLHEGAHHSSHGDPRAGGAVGSAGVGAADADESDASSEVMAAALDTPAGAAHADAARVVLADERPAGTGLTHDLGPLGATADAGSEQGGAPVGASGAEPGAASAPAQATRRERAAARASGASAQHTRVADDDDLAGLCSGLPDQTVVTFV